jgi:tetratricopeptide (TPR) repeat protein
VLGFGAAVMNALAGWDPPAASRTPVAACYTVIGGTFLFVDRRTAARAISRLRRLRGSHPLPDPRLDGLADLVLHAGRVETGTALLSEYAGSSDPERAAMGNLLLAQLSENAGDVAAALSSGLRAYERAETAGDVWSMASAAQSVAQSHSQLAHPLEALEWAERSYEQMSLLQADGDLRQLDWMIAINAIASGDTARGRRMLERYLAAEVDRTGFDYADYYAIGYAGMAEIALAEGDPAEAVRLYDQALGAFGDTRAGREGSVTPWLTMLGAAALVTRLRTHAAQAGSGPHTGGDDGSAPLPWDETDAAAAALRTRILVGARLNPPYLDRPVTACGFTGYAAWMLDPRTADRHASTAGWLETGLTLFALAGRANARQDLASLHRAGLADRIAAACGRDRLDAAEAEVAALSAEDAVTRGLAVLSGIRA